MEPASPSALKYVWCYWFISESLTSNLKSHFSIGTHGSSEVRSDAQQGRSHSINGTCSDWTSSSSTAEPAQPGACRRDGYWFLKLLQAETEWLEGWCCQMDKGTKENNLSVEVLGKVLSAVGSAKLLISQKFQQFQGLCEQNLNPEANPCPTAQDLAGFWDLLQLSIEDISMKFDELYHLKANSWQLVESPEKRKKMVPFALKSKPVVWRLKDVGDRLALPQNCLSPLTGEIPTNWEIPVNLGSQTLPVLTSHTSDKEMCFGLNVFSPKSYVET
ncbi:unnamed protein product [Nyctereutes procyonoides]|uniref:(raccoon dog) hypothetical protein n=1 Tax=Nyctereutes procyonoides TaxID=34880 RepID=A0A811YWZ5_NYCPR|nr:unnamed protein product [Nyctereutes procyonoides]